MWDATKGNATYVEVIKQAKSKDVCHPPHDFGELRSNISTFCALLFTLFGAERFGTVAAALGTVVGALLFGVIAIAAVFLTLSKRKKPSIT